MMTLTPPIVRWSPDCSNTYAIVKHLVDSVKCFIFCRHLTPGVACVDRTHRLNQRYLALLQPATILQAALADFIEEGHFTRHLRRMRKLYGSRQSLLLEAAKAELSGLLEIQESEAGMHLAGWLPPEVSDMEAARIASRHNVLALPLSAFGLKPVTRGALTLGYTAFDDREIRMGVRRLKTALAEVQGVKTR